MRESISPKIYMFKKLTLFCISNCYDLSLKWTKHCVCTISSYEHAIAKLYKFYSLLINAIYSRQSFNLKLIYTKLCYWSNISKF